MQVGADRVGEALAIAAPLRNQKLAAPWPTSKWMPRSWARHM